MSNIEQDSHIRAPASEEWAILMLQESQPERRVPSSGEFLLVPQENNNNIVNPIQMGNSSLT